MASIAVWWKKRLRAFADQVAAPTDAEVTATSVRLSWLAEPGAVLYGLERAGAADATWSTVHTTPVDLTFVDTGLTEATSYLYRLAVTNGAGVVAYSPRTLVTTSTEAVVLETPPTGPDVVERGPAAIDVFMPPRAGATRYILQRIKGA